jgi:hypothetical protein
MSRTSASNTDLRCSCGKCLAKDGGIQCPDRECRKITKFREEPARRAAQALAAYVVCAVKSGGEIPVSLSVKATEHFLGRVSFDSVSMTIGESESKLTALAAQLLVEQQLGDVASGTVMCLQSTALRFLCDRGKIPLYRECGLDSRLSPADAKTCSRAVFELIGQHMAKAETLLSQTVDKRNELVELVCAKGELIDAELEQFFKEKGLTSN